MSQKSSFAAAASQLWNQNNSALEQKSFNINLNTHEKNSNSAAPTEVAKPVGGFVFGSKLASRVTQSDKKTEEGDDGPKNASAIFQSFASKKDGIASSTSTASTSNDWMKNLNKGSDAVKVTDTVVEKPLTGEEGEQNLFQAQCKFFQYDIDEKKWKERGIGNLRLNETNDFDWEAPNRFRLVARSHGTQKVLINSPLFAEMIFEPVSEKRIKISAQTPESRLPQLFLIQSTPAQIAQLTMLLRQRIKEDAPAATSVSVRKRKNSGEASDSEEGPKRVQREKESPTDETNDDETQDGEGNDREESSSECEDN